MNNEFKLYPNVLKTMLKTQFIGKIYDFCPQGIFKLLENFIIFLKIFEHLENDETSGGESLLSYLSARKPG